MTERGLGAAGRSRRWGRCAPPSWHSVHGRARGRGRGQARPRARHAWLRSGRANAGRTPWRSSRRRRWFAARPGGRAGRGGDAGTRQRLRSGRPRRPRACGD